MTRARDELVLTHSESHSPGSLRKPSRFLGEAFDASKFQTMTPTGKVETAAIGFYGVENAPEVGIPVAMLNDGHVRLNVSQVSTYLECPLEFYYRYVLRVPQEPSPMMQYGSLMHSLLEDMNRNLIDGEPLQLSKLESRLKTEWPKSGFGSPRHRDRAFKQAQATLQNLYKRLSETKRVPVSVEEPFALTLKNANLSISGRFDVVFPLGDSVEIVDYKTTTSVDTAEKAKARATASQQLTLYALAWQLLHDQLPVLVTLDFIDTGLAGSVKKTQRGIDGAYSRLQKVADGIRAHDFRPGKNHLFCTHP
jgi:DNA helicase-2/ATP-dependent DNA helicase PcrA